MLTAMMVGLSVHHPRRVTDRSAMTPRRKPNQISTDGPDYNVLKIKPPLCFSRGNAELLARAIERGLADYEEGGWTRRGYTGKKKSTL